MRASRIVVAVPFLVAATYVGGWIGIPIVAMLVAIPDSPRRVTPGECGVAAGSAWAALLAWTATQGPIGSVAAILGGVMRAPPVVVVAATLVVPGLMAWSAALVAQRLWALSIAHRSGRGPRA
ncbi:MAG: hypothetical protein NVS1B4_09650 [Gemmatimonadaceae bacterium]